MSLTVTNIFRYPVKGLSAERLDHVELRTGLGLPQDRRFALAHGTTRFDPDRPEWLPKTNFLMLMRNERLALLRSSFDDGSGTLTLERDGKTVLRSNILEPAGRMVVEQFFAAFMGSECRGVPRLLEASGHMFSDTPPKVVSLIGLASIRDLERITRCAIDPRRFRANVYFDSGRAWQEFGWIGQEIRLGAARLRVVKRISRCAATNVDPETAIRNLNIPRALADGFRHTDLGVYAEVISGGTVAIGDSLAAPVD